MKKFTLMLCFWLFLLSVYAQEKFGSDDYNSDLTSLEYKIQSPIANLAVIPLHYNLSISNENMNVLKLQTTIPTAISQKWLLINNVKIPVINAPSIRGYSNGFGNIQIMSVITPSKISNFTWGFGPAILFPSINKSLGFDKLSVSPTVVIIKQANTFTYGVRLQNFLSIAGNSNTEKVNFLNSEIILSKNLKNGWYVYSSPNITANWNAESNKQWTIPLGAGVGKLITQNRYLPLNLKGSVYKYVANSLDADWLIQVEASFIINSK